MPPPSHNAVPMGPGGDLRLIFRNARWLLTSTFLTQLLSLVSGVILTRHLQASGYGQYAFSYTYAWFVSLFIIWGTRGTLLRYVPQNREQAGPFLVQVMLLRLVTATLAIGATLSLGLAIDKPADVQAAVMIFVLMAGTDAVFQLPSDVFRGLEDMRYEGIFYLIERAMVVAGIALAAWQGWSLPAIAGMMFAVSLGRAVLFFFPLQKRFPGLPVRFDRGLMTHLLRASPQYFVGDVASALALRADVLLLSILALDAHVGWYHASSTIVMAMQVLPNVLTSAMQPTTARLAAQDPAAMTMAKVVVARWAMRVFLPVVGVIAALAPALMTTLFGASFAGASPVLQLLTITLPLLYLNGLAANFYFVTNRHKVNLGVTAASACVVLSLDVLLIPVWGAQGAALAAIANAMVVAVIYYRLGYREFGSQILAILPRPALAGLAAYGTTAALLEMGGWWSVVPGAVVGGAALILTGEVRPADVARLAKRLARR